MKVPVQMDCIALASFTHTRRPASVLSRCVLSLLPGSGLPTCVPHPLGTHLCSSNSLLVCHLHHSEEVRASVPPPISLAHKSAPQPCTSAPCVLLTELQPHLASLFRS